jgi:alkanesulfonate monooxygenase SsuD/methylene tetrahydromethanopterin reductase-like flavin-dependent oxidoreductase (luciferase family)
MGPNAQALAARVADGLTVTWLSPRIGTGFAKEFGEAVGAAGRDTADVELIARAYLCVCDDPDAAREAVRRELVEYVVSPPYGNYFASVGFDDEVTAVRNGIEARDRAHRSRRERPAARRGADLRALRQRHRWVPPSSQAGE